MFYNLIRLFFCFRKKKNKGNEFFLVVQDLLIERIREDYVTWQNCIKFADENYGYNKKARNFFNAFVFYRLSFLDIAFLFKNFLTSKTEFEKKVYAKLIATHLYEFLEDIPQIFGKDFNDQLSAFSNNELDDQLKNIKKSISVLKTDSHSYLKEIRNTVASHKDHNTFIQVEVLDKLDIDKIEMCCIQSCKLYLLLHQFEKSIRKIANLTTNNN